VRDALTVDSMTDCSSTAVRNFVSVGGQHQGVFGLPDCLAAKSWMCAEARKLIDDFGPYDSFVQQHSTQANELLIFF
jgi:palmitoyl-protein thioesterase